MDGMPTLQSDGRIVVLGRLLHKSFRSFPSLLGLQQEMGKEFGFGKTCGEGINLWVPNIQDYLEQSRIKIFIFLSFSDLLVPFHGTLIFAATYPILRQKIQKASCGHLIVCICHFQFQMLDLDLYLIQGFLQSNRSFLPYPKVLVLLQFSLLSLFGNPKSLSRSSPLSGW